MKQIILSLLLLLFFMGEAQVTSEGKPTSWEKRLNDDLESIQMPAFDLGRAKADDAENDKKLDVPFRFGHNFEVNYHFKNSGQWTELENGDRIWRIRFNSNSAQTLNFILTNFFLPKGAKIYLYNQDKSDLLGAYDHQSNNDQKVLGTWFVRGDDITLEYFEPANVKGLGNFTISTITHGYRSLKNAVGNPNINTSSDCNVDVNCPINFSLDQFKDVNKRGVAVIIRSGNTFCTGCLINNTANDGKPYFLTANHCYSDPGTWAFRFNFISEITDCATTAPSQSNSAFNSFNFMSISGATLRARRVASDFCLVEINSAIPAAWNRVWAGWSRSTSAPTRVFGIHHPAGDIMKTCRDSAPTSRDNNGENVWRVSDWEVGVTLGGSSGSPLFDNNGRIIGQLWRGTADCTGTTDNGGHDEYGRFANSWNDGATAAERLRDWLDPSNLNPTTLDLYPTQTCNMPSQNVTSNITRTSATQTWSSLVAAPASGYEWAILTSATPPSSGTVTTATTINNTGLTAGTKYFFHLRSRCTTTSFSPWLTTEFVTECNAISTFPFSEGFESTSATVDCWKNDWVLGRTNWMTRTGSIAPSGATNSITTAQSGTQNARFVARGTFGVANSPTTKLYSQELNLLNYENVTLNFWYGQQQGTSATNQNYTRVFYRTSTSSSWVQLAEYTGNVTTWTNVTLNLPNPSATYQIAFEGQFRSGCANVIDNVTVNGTLIPTVDCGVIAINSPTNITTVSATLNWSAGTPTPIDYEIEYGASPYTFTGTANILTTSNNTNFPLTGLAQSTTYSYRVRSKCTGNLFGNWSSTNNFTTVTPSPFSPYCDVSPFTNAVEPFTLVNFAGINYTAANTVLTPAGGGVSHVNAISTTASVSTGGSAAITIKGNTDGNFLNNFRVFIDWNQDGDFADAGETINAGTISNSTGLDASQAVTTITVPTGALTGTTRMRVKKLYLAVSLDNPCIGGGYGQVIDFSLNIVHPSTLNQTAGEINYTQTFAVSGHVFASGITNNSGQGAGITAAIGMSFTNTNPSTWNNTYSWKSLAYSGDSGPSDVYSGNIGPMYQNAGSDVWFWSPGVYYYATRFTRGGNDTFGGVDANNIGGTWNGTTFGNGKLKIRTQIRPSQGGTTYTNLTTPINAIVAVDATLYTFEFRNHANSNLVGEYTSTTPAITFAALGANATNRTYAIRVKADLSGGETIDYGTAMLITLSNAVGLPQLRPSQCELVVPANNASVVLNAVPVSGASNYQFGVRVNGGVEQIVNSTVPSFNFGQLPNGLPGASSIIAVRVNAQSSGVWTGWGSSCNVTTPTVLTSVRATQCGLTLPANNGSVIINANPVAGATNYDFEVIVNGGSPQIISNTTASFTFAQLSAIPGPSAIVNIKVRATVNTIVGAWGTACNVTTATTLTRVRASQCGITVPANNGSVVINANPVSGATSYDFQVSINGGSAQVINTINPYFTFSQLSALPGMNATINISVRATVNTIPGAYGIACDVFTTAVADEEFIENASSNEEIQVYPNPFSNQFTLKLVNNTEATIQIFDINGKIVANLNVIDSQEVELGTDLTAGIYLVRVEQNNETKSFKMIKK